VATPIPYVRDLHVDYGAAVPVSPLVRRVVAENPNKFTYLGTGTYLVGHGEVAVIDAGPPLAEHVGAILAALEPGERITHLLVTHTHTDHSPATGLLQREVGAPSHGYGPHGEVRPDDPDDRVVFGDPEADKADALAPDPAADPVAAAEHAARHKEGADTDFVPNITLRDGDEVAGPGWTLRAVHTPGHTSNHLCYELVEERTLFSGDHVMGWSTSVIGPPDGNLNEFLASLTRLLGRGDERYLPTHGPAIDDPKPLVRAYLAHRNERTEQLLGVLRRHGPSTLAEIVPQLYVDVPKTLWRAAAVSMYAHLLALLEAGRVVTDGEPKLRSAYELVH
jgi:glyoxylase-like metal-dependent hydrolase (beta-lactamase superfamily II)